MTQQRTADYPMLSEILQLPAFTGCSVCGGTAGLDHRVSGPNVTLATPNHPFLAEEQAFADYPDGCHELEYAQPINHRRPLLAVLRRVGLRRRDHRGGQYHCRRRGGDPRHPTPQHCRRRTRQGAAADQRERPHTCVGKVYKKRASTLIFMQTKSI